ncbi:MAG: hypothetical protein QG608_3866 [Actinomycetota bacterium]|nr:hypothetical protein [Actinomycetota bacterium]
MGAAAARATVDDIQKQIAQVVNKAIFAGRKRIVRVGDVCLHPSEVHLMLVIADGTDTNATRIAEKLGVTKGAVSQTLSRLESKGMLVKEKDPHNQNELVLSLTGPGERVHEMCRASERSFGRAQETYLEKLDPHEKEVVLGFLLHLARTLDDLAPDE